MDAKFNLELLKGLFFAREVVNISVAQIVGFAEEAVLRTFFVVRHDPLRQSVKCFVIVPDHPSPENVIVVPTAIKTYETVLDQILDLVRRWIDHTINAVLRSSEFPIHYEEIRKHFNVVKHNR